MPWLVWFVVDTVRILLGKKKNRFYISNLTVGKTAVSFLSCFVVKMAARFKRKPPGNDNKLLKLNKLTLLDFMCTICQSIYIEPVTLPCYHDFCFACFNGTIENNALSCPLCRTRIGSWLRKASKQNNLINSKLWEFIKDKYPEEVKIKLNGEDIAISDGWFIIFYHFDISGFANNLFLSE